MRFRGHHRNFVLCLALECLWAIHFSVAVTVVFYQQLGIDLTTVLAMQALMGLASTVCDVPFGYLAVRLGVRKVLLIGVVMQLLQCCMFAFWCRTVPEFCVTLVLNGIAWSLTSGTTKAIMTETAPNDITAYAAYGVQARAVGQLFGVLAGGALAANISVATPVLIQPITFVLALPVAYAVRVRNVIHSRTTHPKLSSVLDIGKLMLVTRPQVRWMVLLTASINAAVLAMMWLAQPDMEDAGVTLNMFGFVYAIRTLATAIFAQFVNDFVKRFNRVNTQITLTATVVVCAIFAGSPTGVYGAVAILLANALATAVTDPLLTGVIKDYMPEAAETDQAGDGQAATVYSVASAVQTGLFVVSPLMGWVNKHYSTDTALVCIACITLLFSGWCIHKYRESTTTL